MGTIYYGGNQYSGISRTPQIIIRNGVTVSAGGTVRIPASGTDSRISTASTCIVTPVADLKSSGKPYKITSCVVSNGYVTITMAEAISNINIGIEVINY